jgi:hypothetical protein
LIAFSESLIDAIADDWLNIKQKACRSVNLRTVSTQIEKWERSTIFLDADREGAAVGKLLSDG